MGNQQPDPHNPYPTTGTERFDKYISLVCALIVRNPALPFPKERLKKDSDVQKESFLTNTNSESLPD